MSPIASKAATGSTTPERKPSKKAFIFEQPSSFKGIEMIAPSGKFWIAIPIDKASIACSLMLPVIALAIITPTANPSGTL